MSPTLPRQPLDSKRDNSEVKFKELASENASQGTADNTQVAGLSQTKGVT